MGILDGLFPTPSTTCIHAGVPSRRIQDILSIAATGILPSRRIQDILSINEGRDKSRRDLSRRDLCRACLTPPGGGQTGMMARAASLYRACLTLVGNIELDDIVGEFALFDLSQKRARDGLDGPAKVRVLL